MSAESDSEGPGAGTLPSEEPLLGIDSELTIFALANGLDLYRNQARSASRELEWFRDGMERKIELRADDGGVSLIASATSRAKGEESRSIQTVLRSGLTAEELHDDFRSLLPEALERANALSARDEKPTD